MFSVCVRLALILGAAYFSYKAFETFQQHRYETPQNIYEPPQNIYETQQNIYEPPQNIYERRRRKCKKCILCYEVVQSSHEIYNNSCGCTVHKGCMSLVLNEGQNVCPGCKKPLNNRGGTPANDMGNCSR